MSAILTTGVLLPRDITMIDDAEYYRARRVEVQAVVVKHCILCLAMVLMTAIAGVTVYECMKLVYPVAVTGGK